MENKRREPLFHIVKRDTLPAWQSVGIRIIAILIALVVCAILTTALTGDNPFDVYYTMFQGAFGTERKTWFTLRDLSILLLISLALTPAFKMCFWNIGGEGQVLAGALAAASCMICLEDKIPDPVIVLLMIVTSIFAGAFWAFIPAICKAVWNTNETLSTLMMNYIATQLVAFFIIKWEVPKGSGKIGMICQDSHVGWLVDPMGNKFLLSIIVAAVITVIMYIYLKYTKHGYEIAVLGGSIQTARYAGIKVGKVIVRTVCLSGALCGVVGLLLVGSVNHTLTTTIVGGQGFTAVMVSWLAQFNPFVMVLTSLLIIFLDRGASAIATSFGVNESFSDMITGIILFFIIGCEFFIRYKVIFKKNSAEATVNTAKAEAKGNSTEKIKDKATVNEEKEDEE